MMYAAILLWDPMIWKTTNWCIWKYLRLRMPPSGSVKCKLQISTKIRRKTSKSHRAWLNNLRSPKITNIMWVAGVRSMRSSPNIRLKSGSRKIMKQTRSNLAHSIQDLDRQIAARTKIRMRRRKKKKIPILYLIFPLMRAPPTTNTNKSWFTRKNWKILLLPTLLWGLFYCCLS